jgi:hypothetical protein
MVVAEHREQSADLGLAVNQLAGVDTLPVLEESDDQKSHPWC